MKATNIFYFIIGLISITMSVVIFWDIKIPTEIIVVFMLLNGIFLSKNAIDNILRNR